MRAKQKFILLLMLGMLWPLSCTKPVTTTGGNSAETGNPAIAGTLALWDGRPAAMAQVQCITPQFNALRDTLSDSLRTISDSAGRFDLQLPAGTLCALEASHSSGLKMYWPQALIDTTAQIKLAATLVPTASVRLGAPTIPNGTTGYLVIPGTSYAQPATVEFGSIFADSIFSAQLEAAVFISTTGESTILAEDFRPQPGATLALNSPPVVHELNHTFNTSASGLALNKNLYNFPYLLRLDSSNLNFSIFKESTPLQIFGANRTTPLAHHISRWDAQSKQAEIWINLDTLSAQSIQNLRLVFDETAQNPPAANPFGAQYGYLAVWHFDHDSEHFYDQSDFGFDGRPHQVGSTAGMVGQAGYFNGTSSHIQIPRTSAGAFDISEQDTLTISMWVRLDNSTTSRFVFGKGGFQWHLKFQYSDMAWFYEVRHSDSQTGRNYIRSAIDSTAAPQWEHLTVVQKGVDLSIYRNGVLVSSSANTNVSSGVKNDTLPLIIGAWIHDDGSFSQHFQGAIDELRIESVARDSIWVRLIYENEK